MQVKDVAIYQWLIKTITDLCFPGRSMLNLASDLTCWAFVRLLDEILMTGMVFNLITYIRRLPTEENHESQYALEGGSRILCGFVANHNLWGEKPDRQT